MTLVEFLLARISVDEAGARQAIADRALSRYDGEKAIYVWTEELDDWSFTPQRLLAECAAKRAIIDWHQSWPVLVEQQPTFDPPLEPNDLAVTYTMRVWQQIAWMTQREYVAKFGSEPPTAPVLVLLAQPYVDHPDFDPAWQV